jgi:hypothetical protein
MRDDDFVSWTANPAGYSPRSTAQGSILVARRAGSHAAIHANPGVRRAVHEDVPQRGFPSVQRCSFAKARCRNLSGLRTT